MQPSKNFTFDDIGIDEDKLLKNVIGIRGNADFICSEATNLANLKSIGGNANFEKSEITSLVNLQSIGGDANIKNSKITKKMLKGIVKGRIII